MIHLITGGSGSGKSAFAETCVMQAGASERFYIATMKVWGEEGRRRVEKHRKMRQGKGFVTIECETDLKSLCLSDYRKKSNPRLNSSTSVLLECMSNLTANEMFEKGGTRAEICERILDGVQSLADQTDHLVIVTNEIFSDGCKYDEDTVRYIDLLAEINRKLAGIADEVTEVVFGIPVCLKKELERGGRLR
ncbi:bifunctional adenosylcobinamide kinase/adenosylcobinamide-phosphate guanylyltransferase [Brotaphodocola sp.]|uniref:bifunctional adenosylcobinamide kinase/adenosylcobinamide-phosphate guanylyltransferase n=1 Tax=Brotaphodocola sp. TaxID=3073577 RepID=UPI003D7CB0AA